MTRHVFSPIAAPLLAGAVLIGCAAAPSSNTAATPAGAAGIDLGGRPATAGAAVAPAITVAQATSNPQAGHAHSHSHAHPTPVAGGVPGHGVIDAIDPGRRRVTLSHDPMPEIGWPQMTMVFPVPAAVDLRRFKAGDHVDFTLRKGTAGSYDLVDLRPSDH